MESKETSAVQADGRWMEMDHVSESIHVLSEETLKQITKGSLVKFTLGCEDDQKVSRVFRSLLKTFSTESISQAHLAAACNALSAFLDAGLASKMERTRQLVLSSETWLAVYEVYLSRFEYAKPRPMKQVLLALMKLLVKQQQQAESRLIQSKVGDATIPSVILGEPRSRLRASLVSWEVFIRKNAISPFDLISLVRDWLLANHERWLPVFDEDCKTLGIDTTHFINQASNNSDLDAGSDDAAAKLLVQGLLTLAKNVDVASLAGSVIAVFFQKIKAGSTSGHPLAKVQNFSSIWVAPVKRIMLQNLDILESLSNYILHPLFTADSSGFHCFISQLPLKGLLTGDMADAPLEEFILLFAALQMGKKIGLVHEDHYLRGNSSEEEAHGALILNSEVVGKFLLHRDPSIRVAALSLLIMAPSTTKPLTPSAISAIINGLPSMHAESDSYSRGEILSLTRKLIVRLQGGGVLKDQPETSKKEASSTGSKLTFERSEDETRVYLKAYIGFLRADLCPTASYQRHITALKALAHILESGLDSRVNGIDIAKIGSDKTRWRFNIEIFQPSLLRLLIDLLLDPFEEVRATALSVVKMFPQNILLNGLLQTPDQPMDTGLRLTDAVSRAERIASKTSRADHADTVARLYHILFCTAKLGSSNDTIPHWWSIKAGVVDAILRKLEEKLSLSGGLFKSSMRDAPLHGYVSALRYIVAAPDFYSLVCDQSGTSYDAWQSVHNRIASICDRIWLEVKPVLCIDSPEGHTDEPIEDSGVGPKDILSYSWRALRESSLLLHATLANPTYGPKGECGLKRADYENIGSSSFVQLAELRHRGAFSTVSQTFATCCQRCSQSDDPAISSLPEGWYQEAKMIIYQTASKLTRRSAGLPALVTGILSSDPGGPLFQQVVDELYEISGLAAKHDKSNQEMELPQVHAMNCLKDIFTNTKLGPHTKPFIMPALNLSAERIGSPIWALRNAGLMLFRALLTRMCRSIPGSSFGFGGNSGSEPGARISFYKYPGILPLLSSLLAPSDSSQDVKNGDNAMVTERVFPALELIGEKVPVSGENDAILLSLVLRQLGSPVWGIREHAARVYASLLNRSDILSDIRDLLSFRSEEVTQNFIHGKALCIRYAFRRFAAAPIVYWNGNIEEISRTVQHSFDVLFPSAVSPFVAAALVEILNDVVEKSIESGKAGQMDLLLEEMSEKYEFDGILDYVFDTSNPSWRSLSATRASSLLRRVLAWTTILKMFTSQKLNDLEKFFHTVSGFDPNAARWLLEKMQTVFGGDELHRKSLSSLYSSTILGNSLELVKTAAISNLASILEVLLDSRHDNINGVDLPWEALGSQIESEAAIQTWSREMADAVLHLQGCLLTVKAIFSEWQSSADFDSELRRWAIKLRCALQEETEFTSRYAAVASLSTFGRVLRSQGSSARVDAVFLDVYLILYDMLNDDDEEIRDMAAATASWVLSYSSVSPSKAVALAPLNASELLAKFIAGNYAKSPLLCHKILQYISGQEPRVSDSVSSARLTPVSDLIAEYRKESTVLFVEEKQNLFIDEVREVDVWSRNLDQLAESSYEEAQCRLNEVSKWVSEGLAYLSSITVEESGKDGLLGWTSKPEIFTLGVRVLGIAAALVSRRFPAQGLLGDECQRTLKERLGLLLRDGPAASLNDDWLSRIRAALEFS